uniref:Uncharacterized protein n=1 Tax=Timema poppense TaxID=170557 RepID=A0A7R9GWW6_TIMPO|nr:unnamed protein product [Timema poppensis]
MLRGWEGYTLSQHSLFTEPPYFASSVTIDLGRWPSPSVVAQQRPFQPSSGRESPQEIKICPLLLIALDFVLFVLSLYDMLFSRRQGGNPTLSHGESSGRDATTFNNPGFRERAGRAVSVTDASGKPYATRPQSPNGANGSVASMATVTTTASSNGSTAGSITRSPLRSSLKKPRPKQPPEGGMGIQNPGFSGHSPTFSRNGSVKKVRIQTHSTDRVSENMQVIHSANTQLYTFLGSVQVNSFLHSIKYTHIILIESLTLHMSFERKLLR